MAGKPTIRGTRVTAGTIVSTVQKWEIGQKRPTGTALKLLHLVQIDESAESSVNSDLG